MADKITYLYFLHLEADNDKCAFKIGITNDIKNRIQALQTQNPHNEIMLYHREAFENRNDARAAEKILHQCFQSHKIRGEWFKCDGYIMDAIAFIKKNRIKNSITTVELASRAYKELSGTKKFEQIDFDTETVIYGDGGYHLSCWA